MVWPILPSAPKNLSKENVEINQTDQGSYLCNNHTNSAFSPCISQGSPPVPNYAHIARSDSDFLWSNNDGDKLSSHDQQEIQFTFPSIIVHGTVCDECTTPPNFRPLFLNTTALKRISIHKTDIIFQFSQHCRGFIVKTETRYGLSGLLLLE